MPPHGRYAPYRSHSNTSTSRTIITLPNCRADTYLLDLGRSQIVVGAIPPRMAAVICLSAANVAYQGSIANLGLATVTVIQRVPTLGYSTSHSYGMYMGDALLGALQRCFRL